MTRHVVVLAGGLSHERDVSLRSGSRLHEALRGSQLMLIEGMGHDLPKQVWSQIVTGIAALTQAANR